MARFAILREMAGRRHWVAPIGEPKLVDDGPPASLLYDNEFMAGQDAADLQSATYRVVDMHDEAVMAELRALAHGEDVGDAK